MQIGISFDLYGFNAINNNIKPAYQRKSLIKALSLTLSMDSPTILIFLALTVVISKAWAAPNNCTTQYQAAIQQVLELKETCNEAVYKDCCEVSYDIMGLHVVWYV